MSNNGKAWSWEDCEQLRALYPEMTAREVAERLGRTTEATKVKAKTLGLTKRTPSNAWTKRDKAVLRAMYPSNDNETVARELGRTAMAVKTQAELMGLRKEPWMRQKMLGWSDEHSAILRERYAETDNAEIALLVGRSEKTVENRALQLGLKKAPWWLQKTLGWSDEHLAILRERYADTDNAEIGRLVGRSAKTVENRALQSGLKKAPWWRHFRHYPPELRELALVHQTLRLTIRKGKGNAKQDRRRP